jgi:DNA-binding transcriptional MerR regulator
MPDPQISNSDLPPIPPKRYFTIGEVSELCAVRSHVLRYWEQEFSQLKPVKRRGNRRYYQHHEVMLIRRIRQLLYEEGFTITGARNRLVQEGVGETPATPHLEVKGAEMKTVDMAAIKRELGEILALLK